MLTFLRKIRKSMINSSSLGKYSIYAIGEIALVVIGILIALQINNWNETRKEKIIEKQYLSNLLSDLDGQLEVCHSNIEAEARKSDRADIALKILMENDFDDKLETLDSLLQKLLPRRTFTSYNATFEDLKSSGNIKLIKDQKLRKAILDYYHHVKNMSRVFALNNADLDASYKRAVNENKFGFYKDPSGKLKSDKLNNPEIRETLQRLIEVKKHISRIHTNRLQDLINRTTELQKQIKELEQK